MEEINRQLYAPPFSEAFPMPVEGLLINSVTDYSFGNLNE